MDMHNTFLHSDLAKEVYMKLPLSFHSNSPTKVCLLRKSLYGSRQAPRYWFSKMSAASKKYGFKKFYAYYSLYTILSHGVFLYVLIYVDDLIVTGTDLLAITRFKELLNIWFHMKDLCLLKVFLGHWGGSKCLRVVFISMVIFLGHYFWDRIVRFQASTYPYWTKSPFGDCYKSF